jgi:hypothetical protein
MSNSLPDLPVAGDPPGLPLLTDLIRMSCPVERARVVCRVARAKGTLPPWLAALRRAALLEARGAGWTRDGLATAVGLTGPRISQLLAKAVAA